MPYYFTVCGNKLYTKYLLSGLPRSDSSITRSCLALIATFFTSVNET
ncbi:hypothetical protein SPAB_01889 [Salmonella enterica subsp. enterica serovar Paratyphi B str. SPB7]|uniref:Uncharacterized protein n=1 Tax=Salmonella paratyphi B (strain ATCC BAA-1250 / SPB7) TaxID=1016998 RepID=A0A6C6Z2A0_SALPB|nr:hypothetical protein SPAB_01889 [Salmonella enterica subsp. enterica serovar Paratyphi B str. SPB7]